MEERKECYERDKGEYYLRLSQERLVRGTDTPWDLKEGCCEHSWKKSAQAKGAVFAKTLRGRSLTR